MNPNLAARGSAVAACLLLLSACGSSSYSSNLPVATAPAAAVAPVCTAVRNGPPTNIEAVPLTLAGSFEVPPVTTTATGSGSFTVNRTTGELSGSITVTGTATALTAAHIHDNFAGLNAGVFLGLVADAGTPGKFDVPAASVLAPADLATFLAGGMYVNAHTIANPAGEVRAQIVPGDIDLVRCIASGDFEVPAVATAGTGISYATVNTGAGADSGDIVANVRVAGFADASAAHVHQAAAGINGGIIVPLAQTDVTAPELWTGTGTLTAPQLTAFLGGQTYVNVHTPGNPGGHIRGQLVTPGVAVLRFALAGGQEVPPVATAGSATGYVTVVTSDGTVTANARTSNLIGANAAHVHQGAAGTNGGVVVPLAQPDPATTPELWSGTGTFTVAQLTAFNNDLMYLNVHTPTYPDGEIRGQIIVP